MSPVKDVQREHFEDRKKRFRFLSVELVVWAVGLLLSGVFGFTNLKSDVRDLSTHMQQDETKLNSLDAHRNEDHDILLRMEGDVRAIRKSIGDR